MKRTLASIGTGLSLALIVTLAFGLASAQTATGNNTQTVAKADTGGNATTSMDAVGKPDSPAKMKPVVKVNTQGPDSILPPPDGGELADSCKAEAEGFDAGYCLGIVEGVMASMKLCKKDRTVITLGEAADVTAKYLAKHPQRLKERDVILARKALLEAYACGGSRR